MAFKVWSIREKIGGHRTSYYAMCVRVWTGIQNLSRRTLSLHVWGCDTEAISPERHHMGCRGIFQEQYISNIPNVIGRSTDDGSTQAQK